MHDLLISHNVNAGCLFFWHHSLGDACARLALPGAKNTTLQQSYDIWNRNWVFELKFHIWICKHENQNMNIEHLCESWIQTKCVNTQIRQGMSLKQMMAAVAKDGVRPPIPDTWGAPIKDIIQKCWHADYLQRPNFEVTCWSDLNICTLGCSVEILAHTLMMSTSKLG